MRERLKESENNEKHKQTTCSNSTGTTNTTGEKSKHFHVKMLSSLKCLLGSQGSCFLRLNHEGLMWYTAEEDCGQRRRTKEHRLLVISFVRLSMLHRLSCALKQTSMCNPCLRGLKASVSCQGDEPTSTIPQRIGSIWSRGGALGNYPVTVLSSRPFGSMLAELKQWLPES